MTVADRIQAAMDRVAGAITNVAGDLRELIDKITNQGGISEAEATAIADKLETSASALEAAAAEYKNATEDSSL